MASISELSNYIRFQLSNLRSLNKHHEFEHISMQVARLRICENILPATGPVGSGGDQGKDFESYHSYLLTTPIANSTFFGKSSGKKIVFGCSIQKEIIPKIKSDLQKICGSDTKVDNVYYFCEADVPVSKRHELQKLVKELYQIDLEVFDGQALSAMLATHDLFWIAVEYLSVPADMFPRSESSSLTYDEYKQRWSNTQSSPSTYADFFQLKYGLRRATFNRNEKPDILFWIKKMEIFINKDAGELRRRAIYEIAVASLRGMDNLTSQKSRIEEYFLKISDLKEVSELEDASNLLTYCSVAYRTQHFHIEEQKLVLWMTILIERIELLLKDTTSPETRAYLCMIRGCIELNTHNLSSAGKVNWAKVFKWWGRVIKDAKKAVLFPLERFSDLLSILAIPAGDEPQFLKFTNQVDDLLTKRTGGFIAAEKCRDRALAYYDSGKYLLAIKHLHKSKIHWLSAETFQGSIYAMLIISQCYEKLKLTYAAKYSAAAAIFLIHHNKNDDEKNLLAQACFRLADCCYASGEWLAFAYAMQLSLLAHVHYDASPLDFSQHEELKRHFVHASIMRVLSKRFLLPISELIENKIAEWSVDEELRNELNDLVQDTNIPWQKASLDDMWINSQKDLASRPFCDLGVIRKIEWKALGIKWIVEFNNEYKVCAIAEGFVAIFQIILADLAVHDLCLLPTSVKIVCEVYDKDKVDVKEIPDNSVAHWRISFPGSFMENSSSSDEVERNVFSLAVSILCVCSLTPDNEFMKKIEMVVKEGLLQKTFFVSPYTECYKTIIMPENEFTSLDRSTCEPLNADQEFLQNEHKELAWNDSLGQGYSKQLANKFIKNRYLQSIKSIRLTLPRLLSSAEFKEKIKKLKAEGYLDWQILLIIMNLSLNYRVQRAGGNRLDMRGQMDLSKKMIHQEENENSVMIPVEIFSDEAINLQKSMLAPSAAKVWGLIIKQKTPDLFAIKKLLDVRYNNSSDDIDHEDYWGFSDSKVGQ